MYFHHHREGIKLISSKYFEKIHSFQTRMQFKNLLSSVLNSFCILRLALVCVDFHIDLDIDDDKIKHIRNVVESLVSNVDTLLLRNINRLDDKAFTTKFNF